VPAAPRWPSLPPDLAEALEAGRVEIHLQPIVTLPQRKVRLYEALPFIRTAQGRLFAPAEYRAITGAAEAAGAVDEILLLRCVQIIRRLLAKNRELMIACDLSPAWLASPTFTHDAIEFFEGSHEIASQLLFPVQQSFMQGSDSEGLNRLRTLAATGCRFSMEAVTDLRLDARALAGRGIRYIKVPAAVLLDDNAAGAEIHAADLSGLLARYGIELVATGIDTERMVADILDFDARLAQGNLFSPPRPVRAEVLSDEPIPAAAPAPAPQPVEAVQPMRTAPAPPAPLRVRAPAPSAPPGEAVQQGSVETFRSVQEQGEPPQARQEGGIPAREDHVPRRSAWETLARRVGSRERGQ
jgi:cyclic-di-GMP phosphodiesterase TipF (flagellum assembly factor)